jgi:HEAT repeat protein
MLPRGIDNLLVVGKSYSTDHDGSIGGRMQRDLQHLGEAAGVAAAMAARDSVAPRKIDVRKLQRELVRIGVLREQDLKTTRQPPPGELAEAAAQLGGAAGWDEDPDCPREFGGPVREATAAGGQTPDALRKLYLAGERSIPLLRPLLQSPDADVRADTALVLGMLGDRAATGELLRCLKSKCARTHTFKLEGCSWRSSLPMYYASIILLGRLREKQATPLLVELIKNPQECPPYLASFVIVALGRIGERSAADAIRPYLDAGSLAAGNEPQQLEGAWRQNETNQFEMKYGVRTNAARALARLGDLSGAPTLIDMLDEDSAPVRDLAQRLLEQITGQRFGKDRKAWTRWWMEQL